MTQQVASADLHLHTCYSDGTFTPAELLRAAQTHGLRLIAITDHDTIESFPEGAAAARELDIELLPGIELSAQWGVEDIHLLGYNFDVEHRAFRAWLATLKAARLARLTQMVARLRGLGIAITDEDVLQLAGNGTVGRLHVARALVQRGVVADISGAFDKYLGTHKPAYIEECHPAPEECIRQLRDARGIPVLAHPGYLQDDAAVIARLVPHGLAGLEVYHARHDAGQQLRYLQMAEEYRLLITGGSDCHGHAKGQPAIGTVKLPYTHVDQLRTWHAKTTA